MQRKTRWMLVGGAAMLIGGIFDYLFRCRHKNISRAYSTSTLTTKEKESKTTSHYVVCIDCGREFAYDWERMRIVDHRYERDLQKDAERVERAVTVMRSQ